MGCSQSQSDRIKHFVRQAHVGRCDGAGDTATSPISAATAAAGWGSGAGLFAGLESPGLVAGLDEKPESLLVEMSWFVTLGSPHGLVPQAPTTARPHASRYDFRDDSVNRLVEMSLCRMRAYCSTPAPSTVCDASFGKALLFSHADLSPAAAEASRRHMKALFQPLSDCTISSESISLFRPMRSISGGQHSVPDLVDRLRPIVDDFTQD